jgi:CheY-like chemotaxis protein
MNGIIGCTDILLEMSPTAEQKPYLLMLRNAERLLLTIINDILDFSKLDSAGFTLDMAPLELASVVQGSVDLIRAQAAEKDLSLTAAIDPTLPAWMLGDPMRLRQILLNLLSNAVKFTSAGSVALSAVPYRTGETKQIRFEVRDTGIGVAAERQHLLFQDFSQVHDQNRFGGTGLGLAICKRLVTAMGGSIGMESREGHGSLFWFVLPLMVPDLPDADQPPGPEAPEMPGARILVAEDVKVNQVIVERMLTRGGHQVTLADDGAAALAAMQASTFDLVLMDMRMPVMDGVAATAAIRRLEGPAGAIPIIGLTANATPEDAARCRAVGMDDLLIKPVDRATLLRTLARWRGGRAE